MAASELLQNLIQNNSTENLIQLFRNKSSEFRPLNEYVNHFDNDFFTDALFIITRADGDDGASFYVTKYEFIKLAGDFAEDAAF